MVLKTVQVSLTTKFLFTVQPKLITQQVSRITAFFIRIYKKGQRLSSFKLVGNLFGTMPNVEY
jgi:hypothetical protein